jgi:hypothetical protein
MKVQAYDFGKINVNGKTYTSDVIIVPEEVRGGWWRKEGHRLQIEDLTDIIEAKPDVLVVGTGYYGRMSIPSETKLYIESKGIELRTAKTSEAVKEFNNLQKEIGRVVAALHLTC